MKIKTDFIFNVVLLIAFGNSFCTTSERVYHFGNSSGQGSVIDSRSICISLGVSVYIKDKPSKGTSTDNEGNFKLKVNYEDKVVFTFIIGSGDGEALFFTLVIVDNMLKNEEILYNYFPFRYMSGLESGNWKAYLNNLPFSWFILY